MERSVQNLVSRETLDELWPRHIEDSLQLLPLLRPADLSFSTSAAAAASRRFRWRLLHVKQRRRFTLLEPIAKKAAFLRTVARELDLAVDVTPSAPSKLIHVKHIGRHHLAGARRLAAICCDLAARFSAQKAHMLLHKGRELS